MVVIFKHIHAYNFMSFEEFNLDLDNNGYTIVCGKNLCETDSANSNGSGKSAIWEALIWAITGNTLRNTKDIVNINSTEGAYVEVDFTVDTDYYKIIRSKNHKKFGTNLKIYINDEDKSGKGIKESEKIFAQYLPDLNNELIASTIVLGQGLPYKFSNNSPSGRKEVLEILSRSDYMIEDVKSRLQSRKVAISNLLNDKQLTRQYEKSQQDASEKLLSMINTKLENLSDIKALDTKKSEITEKLDSIISSTSCLSASLSEYKDKLTSLQHDQSQISSDYMKELQESSNANSVEIDELKKQMFQKQATRSTLESKLTSMKASNITVCPTCGQPLKDKIDLSSDIHEVENEIVKLNQDIDDLKTILKEKVDLDNKSKTEINNKYNTRISDISTQIANLNKQITTFSNEIQKNQIQIESYNREISVIDTLKSSYQDQKNQLESDRDAATVAIDQSKEKIMYLSMEIDDLSNRLEILSKMLMLATKEFRGYLLRNVIDFINDRANIYSLEMFGHAAIDFTLDESKILIKFNNKNYENLSGGEKQKIDIIIQFCIRDMLCKFLNFSSNLLVLDEIFDNLDNQGCEKILSIIMNNLTDINSIYIISHHVEELSIPYDYQLNVIKNNAGISVIDETF